MAPRKMRLLIVSGAVLLSAATARAQFPKLVTDFEGGGWTPFVTVVMFRNPSVSGTTTGIVAGSDATYLTDTTYDPFSVVHSGTRADATVWEWANAGYHSSWVRLVTLNADELPNPALHLGGKVRMWISVKAYTNNMYTTPVTNGHLFLGLGVRETGEGVYQGGDGGTTGDVEWVGLSAKLIEILGGTNGVCNTTVLAGSDDVQVIPPGQPAGPDSVCVTPGPDGIMQTAAAGDDVLRVTPRGMFSIPSDGVMRLYEFNLPALESSGNVFSFTGNGTLGATPNNRGTLDHLALTNDPTNAAVSAKVFLVNVDDVTFEAPILDPPSIRAQPTPPRPLDETVFVEYIDPAASQVQVIRLNADGSETVLASINPAGQTQKTIPVQPLASGIRIVARQTVGSNTSDNSTPVVVASAGNGPLRIAMGVRETDAYDHDLPCGADGTGFDPDQPSTLEFIGAALATPEESFGVPNAPRFEPQPDWFEIVFNPCDPTYGVALFSGNGALNLNAVPNWTNGVWEGLYFRIDNVNPTAGPYTVYIDDLMVKNGSGPGVDCLVDDFESYTPAEYIVGDYAGNGMADTQAVGDDVQVVPVGGPVFTGQIIVAPGPNGILETTPQGDDVLSPLHSRFNQPGVAGTSIGLADTPDLATISTEDSFSGTKSMKIQFAFVDATNFRNVLRLTTNGSTATNPPETFLNPDSVIRFSNDGTFCDGTNDIEYSVRIKLPPPEVPGDCDFDGDVDLADFACFQICYGSTVTPPDPCVSYDIAPNHAVDGVVNFADFQLLQYLFIGPKH